MKPDLRYAERDFTGYRPSWSGHGEKFISPAHESVFEMTQKIDGWQAHGDSYKLFEMGYHSGDVILEVGIFSGRSAAVELLGALSNTNRRSAPQYFGVDIEIEAVARGSRNLRSMGLGQYALLFGGNLFNFAAQVDITPTMVFVDGDHSYQGVKTDLNILSRILVADTPVLCHDYIRPIQDSQNEGVCPSKEHVSGEDMWIGVQKACHEWEAEGYAEFYGTFGCSALFLTTSKCTGNRGGLRKDRFEQYGNYLKNLYSTQYSKLEF